MASDTRQPLSSVAQHFYSQTYDFDFQQAMRLLERRVGLRTDQLLQVPFAYQLRSRVFLSAPPSDVYGYDESHPRALWNTPVLEVNLLGLAGMTGPLPMPYTHLLLDRKKVHDHAMDDFLQIFNHRLLSIYRVIYAHMTPAAQDVQPEHTEIGKVLSALGGLTFSRHPWLSHAGSLWAKFRSTYQVQQILESYFEVPLKIFSHEGAFKEIPLQERTFLGQQYNVLGQSASLGGRYWDEVSGLIIQVGPLPYTVYERFQVGSTAYQAVHEMACALLSAEYDVHMRILLDQTTCPTLRLGENVTLGRVAYL